MRTSCAPASSRTGKPRAVRAQPDRARHARLESWTRGGAEPRGPDVRPVTRLAASQPNHSGIDCRPTSPIPTEDALPNRTQGAESKGSAATWRARCSVGIGWGSPMELQYSRGQSIVTRTACAPIPQCGRSLSVRSANRIAHQSSPNIGRRSFLGRATAFGPGAGVQALPGASAWSAGETTKKRDLVVLQPSASGAMWSSPRTRTSSSSFGASTSGCAAPENPRSCCAALPTSPLNRILP
jgi:hypothetical protein